jgi:predicted nucleotidyltransferase
MDSTLQQHLPQIQQLMRQFGVEQAYVFGSATQNALAPGSDVDFLIRFPASLDYETYYRNYVGLLHSLEALLQREVDLVAEETLQNPWLIKTINSHKVQVL